uniref:(California timema) hypothetical protein n=1 Tax=Timema californicum TaxID=61474 RepID=A0A7R9PA95_TIMCA|nr:unnamed protein product [Timema californicum]
MSHVNPLLCTEEGLAAYILCTTEGQGSTPDSLTIGMAAFDPSTGEMIYDMFEDGANRNELERRLEHLNPTEVIVAENVSANTLKLLQHRYIFIRRQPNEVFDFTSCLVKVAALFSSEGTIGSSNFQKLADFAPTTLCCVGVLLHYVKECGLESSLRADGFHKFTDRAEYLQLDAAVLRNLSVFSSAEGSTKNTLYSVLDHTHTKFGARQVHRVAKMPRSNRKGEYLFILMWPGKFGKMSSSSSVLLPLLAVICSSHLFIGFFISVILLGILLFSHLHYVSIPSRVQPRLLHQWISQPLRNLVKVRQRQDMVEELIGPVSGLREQLLDVLEGLPDLERGLTTILNLKCKPLGFYVVVTSLGNVRCRLQSLLNSDTERHSDHTRRLITETVRSLSDVGLFANNLDQEAARKEDKANLLIDKSEFPTLVDRQRKISVLLSQLEALKPSIALGIGSERFEYTSVGGHDFLIEVKITLPVPSTWRLVSQTKHLNRFRSPAVDVLVTELEHLQELLVCDGEEVWLHTLEHFNTFYFRHKRAVKNLATLDVLLSLSEISRQNEYCNLVGLYETRLNSLDTHRHALADRLTQKRDGVILYVMSTSPALILL